MSLCTLLSQDSFITTLSGTAVPWGRVAGKFILCRRRAVVYTLWCIKVSYRLFVSLPTKRQSPTHLDRTRRGWVTWLHKCSTHTFYNLRSKDVRISWCPHEVLKTLPMRSHRETWLHTLHIPWTTAFQLSLARHEPWNLDCFWSFRPDSMPNKKYHAASIDMCNESTNLTKFMSATDNI